MSRFLIPVILFFSLLNANAEETNPLKGIDLGQLQQQLQPILQSIDTKKVLQGIQQVQTNMNTEKGDLMIPDAEPEEGDFCEINDPEHCKEKTMKYEDLKPKQKELLDAAEKVMANSYSPYMKFMVGAALRAEDGRIVVGTNVENAAGTSICAERSAILAANAQGIRKIKTIAVIGKGHDFDSADVIAPCGFCRQVIYESSELSSDSVEIIMSNTKKDKIVIKTIDELLPMAFGPKDLS